MKLYSVLTLFIALLQKMLAYIKHLLDKYRKTACHLSVLSIVISMDEWSDFKVTAGGVSS